MTPSEIRARIDDLEDECIEYQLEGLRRQFTARENSKRRDAHVRRLEELQRLRRQLHKLKENNNGQA